MELRDPFVDIITFSKKIRRSTNRATFVHKTSNETPKAISLTATPFIFSLYYIYYEKQKKTFAREIETTNQWSYKLH